ncbi:MAG: hypothetical protein J5590_06225 [Clostridia bacterium]|nr:hypothetical protein [Clostridia bacterium]
MVGIIIVGEIALSPFAKKYINVLNERGVPYEIVQWSRNGTCEKDGENYRTYFEDVKRYSSLFSKVTPYKNFRRFVKKTLKEQKYQKLIVLTTQTAIILYDVLKKYKNKYFFDYRDTSYEYIKPYSHFINKIILNSYATCISSPGFKKYLTDKKELIVAHNFQDKYYENRVLKCAKRREDGKVLIGYIGYLREFEYLKKLVGIFGSDKRFIFELHGGGDCVEDLKSCAEKYENVKVCGEYKEEDKMDIVNSFDMICYNYPVSFVNYPAVANKFYDGMICKKPMFGNSRTFSGELIEKYGLGISLDEEDTGIAEKVYNYYESFDREDFEKNCEDFLASVIEDDKKYINKINEFLD